MAKVVVMYNQPADPAAFDKYYFETHVPIADKIPGLRSGTVNKGPVNAVMGGAAPYLIAELQFDSMEDLQAGLVSSEGRAAAADLANFATGGATIYAYDTRSF
ncbi:MAG TPA: EthD family reductase [Bryobacteraceae bacterium]|nr:EthD family reductase [Bryobacteraceae bacterium]